MISPNKTLAHYTIVYDIGTNNGSPYIVAELLEGQELRDRLDAGQIPLRKAIDYAQQIVSGLSAAHEKGIVHRDLKPENLFVTNDDRVKILDFGLAKLRGNSNDAQGSEDETRKVITNPGVVMGTVGYMSPEQVRGEKSDHRSDIFSFGAIMHEMITGRRAFRRDTMAETMTAILREEPDELSATNPNINPALERIVNRCLEKKPERRFHSAHDLGFALESLSAQSSSASSSGSGLTTQASSAAIAETKIDPNYWFHRAYLGRAYEHKGMLSEATAEFQRGVDADREQSENWSGLAHAVAVSGKKADAEKILNDLISKSSAGSYVSPYNIAVIYAGLADNEKALSWLERAYTERSYYLPVYLTTDERLDHLRSEPRFKDVLRKIGLPD